MTKNREHVKLVESQSDSGEEVSSEESDSQESDSESEQQTAAQNKSQPQPAVKPRPPPSSSEEEESETESDSDEPVSNVRPLASKPIEKAQRSTDSTRVARSKPSNPEPVTPTKSAAAKRPSEDTAGKDVKKAKKAAEPETSEKKPNLFQRLWSEEDEIVILKGMINYAAKHKSDPLSDLNAFHEFIKKNLHLDFSRTQLQDKIRRLKKKYGNNKSKEKEGKERSFSKSHEQSVYDLSKEIWGKESGKEKVVGSPKTNGSVAKKSPSKKGNAVESGGIKGVKNVVVAIGEGDKSLQNLNYIGGSIEERWFQNGRELYEVGEGVEEEREWEKLKVAELELYLKQLEVRIAHTKLVLNGMKGRDH